MGGGAGPTKWQGKCAVELVGITPDQVWPVLSDFCNGNEWFPAMHTCHKVEGDDGRPGLIRYCTGSRKSVVNPTDVRGEETVVQTIKWAYERLTVVDPYERQVSYEVLENNIGLISYVATMRAVPIAGGADVGGADGCRIEWTFESDPITGRWNSAKEYESFLGFNLRAMAMKLEVKFKGENGIVEEVVEAGTRQGQVNRE